MDEPTLTLFLPNNNYARFLPEALKSLKQQTRHPQEIINADGATSSDKPRR